MKKSETIIWVYADWDSSGEAQDMGVFYSTMS